MDMAVLIAYLLGISAAGQQIGEQLFGAYLKGLTMLVASWGVTIGVAFVTWTMNVGPLSGLDAWQVLVYGAFAGLGANVIHAVFQRFVPQAVDSTFGKSLKSG